jgi:hypothetical protein
MYISTEILHENFHYPKSKILESLRGLKNIIYSYTDLAIRHDLKKITIIITPFREYRQNIREELPIHKSLGSPSMILLNQTKSPLKTRHGEVGRPQISGLPPQLLQNCSLFSRPPYIPR